MPPTLREDNERKTICNNNKFRNTTSLSELLGTLGIIVNDLQVWRYTAIPFQLTYPESYHPDYLMLLYNSMHMDALLFNNLRSSDINLLSTRLTKWRQMIGHQKSIVGGLV
ncbi:hypothetical protein CVT25_002412 [Psilocybe cyanescens]|uniref:Uncharacterized protein n=1 Tax=Psilocybe cyanescens TaxID=93625 RepID=A0A409X0C3_PSICY|nr:hypothetical protein CVT25_002412 [Psilocybe cyanescens]